MLGVVSHTSFQSAHELRIPPRVVVHDVAWSVVEEHAVFATAAFAGCERSASVGACDRNAGILFAIRLCKNDFVLRLGIRSMRVCGDPAENTVCHLVLIIASGF